MSWVSSSKQSPLQVLTGTQPFLGLRSESILYTVVSGSRPARPENSHRIGLSKNVWELMEQCWSQIAAQRPDISAVLKVLNDASRYWMRQPLVIERSSPISVGTPICIFDGHRLMKLAGSASNRDISLSTVTAGLKSIYSNRTEPEMIVDSTADSRRLSPSQTRESNGMNLNPPDEKSGMPMRNAVSDSCDFLYYK